MSDFWTTLVFSIVIAFRNLVHVCMFWVNTPFLKTLSFSLFMINLIQYFETQKTNVQKYLTQALYLVYILLSFLLPYYERDFQIFWWEWILLVPFVLVGFLGIIIRFTEFGRKYLNYYMMNLYYGAISVIACAFFPEMGIWWGCLIFTIISIVFANIGGLWQHEAY
jgi:hypothetical protein